MDAMDIASETVDQEATVPVEGEISHTTAQNSQCPLTRQSRLPGQSSTSRTSQSEMTAASVSSIARDLANNVAALRLEFKALQERVAALGRRIRDEQRRETNALSAHSSLLSRRPTMPSGSNGNVSSRTSGNLNATRNNPLSRNMRIRNSKYAKKKRLMIPGGPYRVSRSFKDRPLIKNVGSVDLSSIDWYDYYFNP